MTLYEVGNIPYKVAVVTRPGRGSALWLRWRAGGNWRHERIKGGDADTTARADYERAAHERLARLLNQLPEADRPKTAPLTIRQGLALVIDPGFGKYPVPTQHRAEVEREVDRAAEILKDKPWAALEEADLIALWRARIDTLRMQGKAGLRGAEITVARLLGVAAWLRRHKHIPAGACLPPERWKKALEADWRLLSRAQRDYTPSRPRHTTAEMRKILARVGEVDPRADLLFAIGAEQRLGQVLRARRSWLDLEGHTFTIHGAGKKEGAVLVLTPGQQAAVTRALEGYLRTLELRWRHDAADYALFPGRRLVKGQAIHADARALTRAAALRWLREAEALAGVPHLKGRGNYGLRRAGVDGAKREKISREGLKEYGGWSSPEIPDRVYAEQEQVYAREEAAKVRARLRGEPETPEGVTNP